MSQSARPFLEGEVLCTVDADRRVTVRNPLAAAVRSWQGKGWLVKERRGAISLWPPESQEARDFEAQTIELIESKIRLKKFDDRIEELLKLGRLMSTRRTEIEFKEEPRFLLPKEFCQFLRVEPGGKVYVVGAAVCLEIWQPQAWIEYVEDHIDDFRRLFGELAK